MWLQLLSGLSLIRNVRRKNNPGLDLMKMNWNTLMVVVFICLIISSNTELASASDGEQRNCVKRHLGLADSDAYAGFLFTYKIPYEAFTGEISEYKVSEACEDTLPVWLTFDPNNRTFKGLPQAGDAGLVHICVKAVGTDGTFCSAKDIFRIDVKTDLPSSFSLPDEEYMTSGHMLVNITLSKLQQTELFNIFHSLSSFFQIPEDSIRLVPYERGGSLQQTNQGLRIQFQVGCSSDEVNRGHRLVNLTLEAYETGELTSLVGYPVSELNAQSCYRIGKRPCLAGSDFCHMPDVSPPRVASESLNLSSASAFIPTAETFVTGVTALNVSVTAEVNHKPLTDNKMGKLVAVAGKIWIYKIPEDTFTDIEDGGTRNLHLTFTEGYDVPSWIHFNSDTQTLTALPLDDHIGRYMLSLDATNKRGASATKRMELIVKRHLKSRRMNHEFIVTLTDNDSHPFPDVTLQTEILNSLSQALGHNDANFILVKSITFNPFSIAWLNENLILESCPFDEIRRLYSTLASENGEPKETIENLMPTEFQIQKVELKFTGTCLPAISPPAQLKNFAPVLRNAIDIVDVTVGEMFRFKIPDDVFYDLEDGGTSSLLLTLHNLDSSELSESSWLQFDSRNQEILAIANDENIGQNAYVLRATDNEGSSVSDTFVLHVSANDEWGNPSVKFSISVDENFDDIRRKILFVEKLSEFCGDDSSLLIILNITESPGVLSWTNKTLAKESCAMDEIRELSKLFLDDDCHPAIALVEAMEPEFSVTKVNIALTSDCAKDIDNVKVPEDSSHFNLSSCAEYKLPTILEENKSFTYPDAKNDISMGETEDTVEFPPTKSSSQPTVKYSMPRFRITAGKMWIYEIPEDIFQDVEDGNTRNLKLELLTRDRNAVILDSWIHFDSETQVLSACPLSEHVGKYEYLLRAIDSEGSAVEEPVNIYIAQHHFTKRFNHEFTVTLKYNKRHHPVNVDWQIQFVEKLARIIGHNDVNLITLRSVAFSPVKFTWVNDNLLMPSCPFENIRNIYSRLSSEDGMPTKLVTNLMLPEFRILKIELRFSGNCEQSIYP